MQKKKTATSFSKACFVLRYSFVVQTEPRAQFKQRTCFVCSENWKIYCRFTTTRLGSVARALASDLHEVFKGLLSRSPIFPEQKLLPLCPRRLRKEPQGYGMTAGHLRHYVAEGGRRLRPCSRATVSPSPCFFRYFFVVHTYTN